MSVGKKGSKQKYNGLFKVYDRKNNRKQMEAV
jgi:hypothetical protein